MTAAAPSAHPPAEPLLRMRGMAKRFGATQALRGVDFDVAAGEVLALVGENGAGKSTLMKILSGALQPDAGSMLLAGGTYAPGGPLQARQAGVAMIYQELNLAPHLSVVDNILLGQERRRWGWLDRAAAKATARRALGQLGHGDLDLSAVVGRLSVGMQQIVEIARALVMEARLVVFDEPTSSLAGNDVERLFSTIDRLKGSGIAVVYISHFLEEVRRVADRYTVLRDGESVGSGSLTGVGEREIVALMVGRSIEELFPHVPHSPGEELLVLDGLTAATKPRDVRLSVRRGEILGVAGLVGAGRTELLRCLYGLDPVVRGTVRVAGATCGDAPRNRIAAGLGLVSEDRKAEGLAQELSIADNLTLSNLRPYSRGGWLQLGRRRARVADWLRQLQVKARDADQAVRELSGGNQQKVAIARVLHQNADVLLLDEPTRGIDVGTKAEIYHLLGTLAAQGKAIVFVSSYLPELLAICDRVAVMSRGRVRAVRPVKEWTEESVMSCAVEGEE